MGLVDKSLYIHIYIQQQQQQSLIPTRWGRLHGLHGAIVFGRLPCLVIYD